MAKGRWQFNVKSSDPKLYAIVRLPDGRLVKQPVNKSASTMKKYEAYMKSVNGLFVPKSMKQYLHQPGQRKP